MMEASRLLEKLNESRGQDELDLGAMLIENTEFIDYVVPWFHTSDCTKLHLSENEISDAGVSSLLRSVRERSQPLIELDLGSNNIGRRGATYLANIIGLNHIKSLILHSNSIRDEGLCRIARALPDSSLEVLDLFGNEITDVGVLALAVSLPQSRLHSLDLSRNRMTNLGAVQLILGMRFSSVTLLNIDGNPDVSQAVFGEIEKTEQLVRGEFRVMVVLCSARAVPRLGHFAKIKVLPNEIIRRIGEMLYQLCDLRAASFTAALENPVIPAQVLGNQNNDEG
jgi:hypothetical protein